MGEALEQLILGAEEKLQESLGTLEKDIQRVQEGQDNLRKEVLGRLRELQNSVDHLAQSATWRQPEWRGVGRASATLRTLDDVLDLVLPDVVKSAPPELRDAIISTAVEQLLENVSCLSDWVLHCTTKTLTHALHVCRHLHVMSP